MIERIINNPIPYAHSLGYTKLSENIHKDWIRRIFFLKEDGTLQAHRGSYKTTCLIIALSLWIIARPMENVILLRKSQEDVKDVINAVNKIIMSDVFQCLHKDLYGVYPKTVAGNSTEIELSTYRGNMGRQLLGLGLNSSITGKHGAVITDDIVSLKDRVSEAERNKTKNLYLELHNIASEENHNIFNTGTPWHKNDAFCLMPAADRHTVYDTGIMSKERIEERKSSMPRSLWAANYELKHIADGDVLFPEPSYGGYPIGKQSYAHIDAAYGGPDSNALTIMTELEGKLYTIGWKMEGHIDQHYKSICSKLERYQVSVCYCEDNADKGFLRKDLSARTNVQISGYHESTNKYYKISTYGKSRWKDVIFDIDNGDLEYINGIMDYNENAEHDDCPDSFSSLIRKRFRAGGKPMSAGGI